MDKFLKIFLSGLISFPVLNAGIFLKAETPSSDHVFIDIEEELSYCY